MPTRPSAGFRRLSVITALVTYLLIVAGDVVRVTGSGVGCGDGSGGAGSWPLCNGHLVPPADLATVIEFSHRMFATATTILVAVMLVWAWTRYRHLRKLPVIATVTAVLLVIQILLGAATVLSDLLSKFIFIHLANAELVLASTVLLSFAALTEGTEWHLRARFSQGARLVIGMAVATFIVILSGALVVDSGSIVACHGWPLCATSGGLGFNLAQGGSDAINFLHRLVVIAVVVFLCGAVPFLRRRHAAVPGLKLTTMLINVLVLLQIAAGAFVVFSSGSAWAQGLHLALGTALWLDVVVIAYQVMGDPRRLGEASATGPETPLGAVVTGRAIPQVAEGK